jgi:hypothetical protein
MVTFGSITERHDAMALPRGPRRHAGRQAERLRMTWARHASPTVEQGRFAEVRASEKIHYAVQNRRAAHTVATHASDAQDCANLLAMLGLDTLDEHGAMSTAD